MLRGAGASAPPSKATITPAVELTSGKGPPQGRGRRDGGDDGGGGDGPLGPAGYRIGMWAGLAAVGMLFAGLASAYIVRAGEAPGWQPLSPPPALWVSTSVLLISSFTFVQARSAFR